MDTWKVLEGSGVGFLERVVLGPRIGGFVNGLMCSFDGLECLKFFDDEIGCVERGGKDVEKEKSACEQRVGGDSGRRKDRTGQDLMCEDSVLIESVRRDRLEYMCLELQGARVALRGGWVGLKENECSLCSLPPEKKFSKGFPQD